MVVPRPSTGKDLLRKRDKEIYALTWTSKGERVFENPTGGIDTMEKGENMMYFAKKEQCMALGVQLRTQFKINDWKIYRIFPDSQVQFLYPMDGVASEKANEGRVGAGNIPHSIGKNPAVPKMMGMNGYMRNAGPLGGSQASDNKWKQDLVRERGFDFPEMKPGMKE
jgi:photosystem I subunit 2